MEASQRTGVAPFALFPAADHWWGPAQAPHNVAALFQGFQGTHAGTHCPPPICCFICADPFRPAARHTQDDTTSTLPSLRPCDPGDPGDLSHPSTTTCCAVLPPTITTTTTTTTIHPSSAAPAALLMTITTTPHVCGCVDVWMPLCASVYVFASKRYHDPAAYLACPSLTPPGARPDVWPRLPDDDQSFYRTKRIEVGASAVCLYRVRRDTSCLCLVVEPQGRTTRPYNIQCIRTMCNVQHIIGSG